MEGGRKGKGRNVKKQSKKKKDVKRQYVTAIQPACLYCSYTVSLNR